MEGRRGFCAVMFIYVNNYFKTYIHARSDLYRKSNWRLERLFEVPKGFDLNASTLETLPLEDRFTWIMNVGGVNIWRKLIEGKLARARLWEIQVNETLWKSLWIVPHLVSWPPMTNKCMILRLFLYLLLTSHKTLRLKYPQIECNRTDEGFERFACPSPDPLGRYRCIEDRLFCDGYKDCPDGEDEDSQSCMFYRLVSSTFAQIWETKWLNEFCIQVNSGRCLRLTLINIQIVHITHRHPHKYISNLDKEAE